MTAPIGITLSLDGVQQTEAGLRRVAGGVDAVGMSAKQTAAALRGVPAQFTDIVTSLASGQQPLTVFLQQGGQLKDMFGGAGNAAKALGGYVVGLVNPFTVAAAAGVALALAYKQGSAEADAYRLSIISTGNAAGTTSAQLKSYAQDISAIAGTQGKAAESLAAFVATGKVSNELLRESAQSAVLWERATGQAASKTAEQFASLKGDPLASVLKLNEGMNFLTKSTYEQIKSLDEQGKTTAAAAVAQQAYATALTSRSSEIQRNLGSIERGWIAIKDAAKGGWDAMLNVGRAETTLDRLAQVRKEISATEAQLQGGKGFATTEGGAAVGVGSGRTNAAEQARLKSRLTSLGAEAASLEAIAYASRTAAEEERKRGEAVVATAAFDQAGLKYLSDKQKLKRELAAAREQGLAANKTQAQIEERLNQIREDYRKKAGSGGAGAGESELATIKAKITETEKYIEALRTQGLEGAKLNDGERMALKITEDLKTSITGTARANKELALVEAEKLGLVQRAAAAEERRQKAVKKSTDEYAKLVESTFKAADALQDQADKQEAANAVYGKGAAAIDELALATLKSRMAEAQASDSFSDKFIAALEAQIQAQERLNAARAEGRFKEMNESLDRELAAANQQAALYQDELRLTGLSVLERAKIVALRQSELELARDLEKIEQSGLESDDKEQLRIKAREKQRVAGSAAVNKVIQDDFTRTSETIERSLTDALLRGFESGKGFAKNLRDTIANMFKTLVLRPIISAVVNPVAGAITGALGLAGTASAGTSALGAVSTAASGASLLGNAAGLLGGAGTAAGYGFSALMSGNGLGALSGGLGMLTSGGPAAIMAQGAGMIAGVLGPIALGIGALTAIIGKTKGETRTGGQFGVSFDGTVTNQRRDQTYTYQGQQFDRDFSNGQRTALTVGQAYRLEGDPVAQEQAIRDAVAGTASGINAMLKALGSTATLSGFSAGLETSSKDRGGVFSGGIFQDGRTFGESGKGDNYARTLYEAFSTNSPDFKQALADFTLDLKQSSVQALQAVAADLPRSVQSIIKDVNAEGLTDEAANALLESINAQIVGVNQLKDAFSAMGMDRLAGVTFDVAAGLAEVSGGFDKLQSNLGTYYSNFYSPEEQRANMQRQLAQQLQGVGLNLPDINATDARAQYRRLVEAAEKDLSEEGRKTYATLLKLSGAFAGIAAAADDATQALERQRTSAYDMFKRTLDRDRSALNDQATALRDTIGGISDAVDMLRSNARDLRGTVAENAQTMAAQGMVYIERAIAGVRAGASVTDYKGLADAVGAARGGIDSGIYRNDTERGYDALVLAGQLSTLGDLGDMQLTVEEQNLKAVNKQLEYLDSLDKSAQEMVNGTTELTGTVQDNFDRLMALFAPKETTSTGAKTGGAQFAGVGGGGGGGGSGGSVYDPDLAIRFRVEQQLQLAAEKGLDHTDPTVLQGINATLYGLGASNADLARIFESTEEDMRRLFASAGIERFATGAAFTNGIVTRPTHFNIGQMGEGGQAEGILPLANVGGRLGVYAVGAQGGDNAALLEELRALRLEVAALKAVNEVAAGSAATSADVLVRVTNNGNGMVTANAPL